MKNYTYQILVKNARKSSHTRVLPTSWKMKFGQYHKSDIKCNDAQGWIFWKFSNETRNSTGGEDPVTGHASEFDRAVGSSQKVVGKLAKISKRYSGSESEWDEDGCPTPRVMPSLVTMCDFIHQNQKLLFCEAPTSIYYLNPEQ